MPTEARRHRAGRSGSYGTSSRDVPFANAERAIPLPEDIAFEEAASLLLRGLTAHYLVHDSFRVQAGDECSFTPQPAVVLTRSFGRLQGALDLSEVLGHGRRRRFRIAVANRFEQLSMLFKQLAGRIFTAIEP